MTTSRIYNTHEAVVNFYHNVLGMQNKDYDFIEIVSLILQSISNQADLKPVPQFDDTLFSSESDQRQYIDGDIKLLNEAIEILRNDLYRILICAGAYENGMLVYDDFDIQKNDLYLIKR